MSMGKPFDPHDRAKRELALRAKNLLRDRGTDTAPSRGTTRPSRTADAGRVFAHTGGLGNQLTVRFRMIDERGQPYKLVYSEGPDGHPTACFADLLYLAVEELRQHQILDDLANA